MKKNKLKELAENIATLELKLEKTSSSDERGRIENEIMLLSENNELTLEDYFKLDDLILDKIEKLKARV